jgi:glycosyltransferase involved in cell wall biosynthesis
MGLKNRISKKLAFKSAYQEDPQLDLGFYRNTYADLATFTDEKLYEHWFHFGKKEGRLGNLTSLDKDEFEFDLDLYFYLYYYPDLKASGISHENEAKLHWLQHGKQEQRFRTVKEWMEKNNYHLFCDPRSFNFYQIITDNSALNVSSKDLLDLSIGRISKPISILQSKSENAKFYQEVGINCYLHYQNTSQQEALVSARTAWRISNYFKQSANVIELIGNTYLDSEDFRTAQKAYKAALDLTEKPTIYLLRNILKCYEKQFKLMKGIEVLKKVHFLNPSMSILNELLDEYANKLYQDYMGGIQVLGTINEREQLKQRVEQCSSVLYNAYYDFFSKKETKLKENLNLEKVLIVGDYHVPQCIRYRIDQKVEQFELQGKQVRTVDWMELAEHQNELALHDIVIFYRVPAVPQVLKAMAQVNANGKASFYEIDDLLFEESYPAPIETFGGYIGLDTHIELRKSMANFYAAAKHCRFGISSTQLLCDKLEQLVMDKKCLLHRNGLDKLNVIRKQDKSFKKTIDIFYGSGTQAHNSDFIEQALPALELILSKHKQARLIIAGYLQLPQHFLLKYKSQLQQVPPIKNVKAYWALLEQADINLAVLHDDEINGCKSELKWFEAACFSIPSIVSSTVNYRDVLTNGQDALIASNETEWFDALDSLIINSELRKQIAQQALTKVQTEYTVEHLGQSLTNKLDNLLVKSDLKPKKKLALVNVFFPPQAIGGATRVVSDNFDILQKQYGDEYELVIFTSDDRCTTPYQLTSYQHNGVTVYRSTILYRENMDWHSKDENMYTLFEQFLTIEKPDLIHFHCVQRLTASIVEAAKDKQVPYIVTAHDAWWISDHQFLIDANDNIYPEGHPDIFAPRALPNNVTLGDSIERLIYYRELLKGAKTLLTVSESFADIYRKNGYPEIQVNKNGISSSVEWLAKDTGYTDKVVCAHIGGMANHKGYFLLKEAIEKEQPMNIELLIVDHSKEDGYEQKTHWNNVPVTFTGRVSQTQVTKLYQNMDVLFAPSMWPESYGLVTREAAACGCWVVASDLGGIGEDLIEGKTGLKVKPELNSLCKAVNTIDRNAMKFKQNIEQADIRIVDKQIAELMGIYNG